MKSKFTFDVLDYDVVVKEMKAIGATDISGVEYSGAHEITITIDKKLEPKLQKWFNKYYDGQSIDLYRV